MKKRLIIFIMMLSLFLTGCGCAILHIPPNINKKEYENAALDYTRNEVGTENYDYVSSKKIDSEHKEFYFSSTDRELEFKTTFELMYSPDGLPHYEEIYSTNYYQEVYKFYENRVNDLLKNSYSNITHKINNDYNIDIIFKIESKDDIEKYLLAVKDLNTIFSDENKYGGMRRVFACVTDSTNLSSAKCSYDSIYSVGIDGNTTDSSNEIREGIYKEIKDYCIKIKGLENLCEKIEIDDIYLNDHKMTYDEASQYSVYISPHSPLAVKYDNNTYYIEIKESDGQSVFAQYLTVLGISYTISDDTISFERDGNKYEISGKHENSGSDATTFKVLINDSEYPCDYTKYATGYLRLNIDNFSYILGLTYKIDDSIHFKN